MLLYNKQGLNFYCDNELKLTDLYPIWVTSDSAKPKKSVVTYMQNNYAAFLIKSGSAIIKSLHSNLTLSGGQAVIFDSYNRYSAEPVTPIDYVLLKFSGERASDFAAHTNLVYDVPGLYDELYSYIADEGRHDVYMVSFLYRLYGALNIQKSRAAEKKPLNRYVKMVIDNINDSYLSPGYTLADVADSLGLNSKYISRLFKKEVGISMQEFLKIRRLETAYELLAKGYKVKDVTWRCGIRDSSNLSEMFKKYYGIRPSEVLKRRY